MTASRTSRILSAVFAVLVLAVPAHASKRRAVSARSTLNADISGRVLDNVTGQPVRSAKVEGGGKDDNTDSEGRYRLRNIQIAGTSVTLTVSRTGYATKTVQVTQGGAQTLDIRVDPLPTVSVKTTDDVTRQIDFDSIRFGYIMAFSDYVSAEFEDFCKPDGSTVKVDRSEMKRITGPATKVTSAACCPGGEEILKANLELKTGEKTDVFFTDSCDGYMVDLIGRNHVTGKYEYIHFTQIAEIVFP